MTQQRRSSPVVPIRKVGGKRRLGKIHESPIAAFFLVFIFSVLLTVFVLFMQRRWRGNGQRAVVIVHDDVDAVRKPLTIAVIDPTVPRLTLMPLSPEKPISPLLGYGSYQSQALAGLTQLDGLRWEFFTASLSVEYGVAIDGILWSKSEKIESRGDIRAVVLAAVANQTPTTLAYWDRWRLLTMLESIPDYELDISFPTNGDEDALEKWAAKSLQDHKIRSSGLTVALQNASGIQGLAARYSRMLRIMGYDVRNIETIDEQEHSRLVHSTELSTTAEGSWALQRIEAASGYLKAEADSELPQKLRSDIVIVLGTDMRQRLTLRPPTPH